MVHAVTYKRGRYVAFDSYCACENRAWRETSALGHVDNPARLHTARDRTGHCIEDTTPPGAPPHGRLALALGRRGPMPWPMRGTPGFPWISPDVLRAILGSRRCVLPLGSSPGVYTVFLFGAREVVNRRHDLHRIFEHGFAGGGFPFIQRVHWLSLCEMVFALRGARGGQSCGSRVGAVHLGSDTLSPRLLTAPASALGTRLSARCLAVGCSVSHAQSCRNSTPCDTQRPLDPSALQHSAHSRKGNRSGD